MATWSTGCTSILEESDGREKEGNRLRLRKKRWPKRSWTERIKAGIL
jgi:hypothetical protein